MSRKYNFHNPDGVYFVSFAVNKWVDVFTRNEYKNILGESLRICQQSKGLEIFAWCIMTNHVHLIVRAKDDFILPDILRDFKKFTSKSILKAIAENTFESRKEWLNKLMMKTFSSIQNSSQRIEIYSSLLTGAPISNRRQRGSKERFAKPPQRGERLTKKYFLIDNQTISKHTTTR